MTAMISEVYEAFKEANVSDATARKASEAITAYKARSSGFDLKLEHIDGRLTLVFWQLGILIAGVLALVIKAFV
jgi:hypothetical protein